jgi:PAS domain S-box-containing protein
MRRGKGLANYIGVGSLYLILIPLVFTAIWASLSFNSAIRRSIASANALSAGAVAGRLEEFLARPRQALARMVSLLENPRLYNRESMNEYLADAFSIYPFLEQVEVIGPDGRIEWMAPHDPAYTDISRSGEEIYESVKASNGLVWSSSYISPRSNAPAVTFGRRAGAYLVLCDLNLSAIERFSSPVGDGSAKFEISITDEHGLFLSNSDGTRVRRREQQSAFSDIRSGAAAGGGFEIQVDGVGYLASVSELSDPRWYVLALYPVSGVTNALKGFYAGFISILLGAAGLGFAISRVRVRRISQALEHLSSKAARISRGEYDELVEFGEGFAEFELVGEHFNGMIAGIRTREAALIDRERGFRRVLEEIRLLALGVDGEGRIRFANACFLEDFGYTQAELYGKHIAMILPLGSELSSSPFIAPAARDETGPSFECEIISKNGKAQLVQWTVTPSLDASGAPSGVTGIGTNITESRRQRRLLESSLSEKEILLKEVHHRVKNNLQLISSLLSLQKDEGVDKKSDRRLENAQRRIRSISLVHEMLYDSDNFGAIDIGEYALALAQEVLQGDGRRIALRPDIQAIRISLNEAIPCGLILNEALTNIRKYAFPPDWTGETAVDLCVARDPMGRIVLRVRDSGIGLPADFDPGTGSTLGHTIMNLLAQQVNAKLVIASDRGTKIELAFTTQPGRYQS